jgi:hypothetical protein
MAKLLDNIWSKIFGEILQPHPAPCEYWVSIKVASTASRTGDTFGSGEFEGIIFSSCIQQR